MVRPELTSSRRSGEQQRQLGILKGVCPRLVPGCGWHLGSSGFLPPPVSAVLITGWQRGSLVCSLRSAGSAHTLGSVHLSCGRLSPSRPVCSKPLSANPASTAVGTQGKWPWEIAALSSYHQPVLFCFGFSIHCCPRPKASGTTQLCGDTAWPGARYPTTWLGCGGAACDGPIMPPWSCKQDTPPSRSHQPVPRACCLVSSDMEADYRPSLPLPQVSEGCLAAGMTPQRLLPLSHNRCSAGQDPYPDISGAPLWEQPRALISVSHCEISVGRF